MKDISLWTYALLLVSIFCSSAAQIFQKLASADLSNHSGSPFALLFKRNIILSILFLGTGLILWLMVLGKLELSIAYPMLSLGYVIVMLSARWFFGEVIPLRRWFGTALIVFGVYVLVGLSK